MIQHPIVADIKGAKERHLQLGVFAARDNLGLGLSGSRFAIQTALSAGVEDADQSIVAQGVGCGYTLAPALESGFVSGDLIPAASITAQVYGLGRLWDRCVADRAALKSSAAHQGNGGPGQ